MISCRLPLLPLTSALVLAFYAAESSAQITPPVLPDAGRVFRELQTPAMSPPAASNPEQRATTKTAEPRSDEVKVFVKTIVITGNKEIPTSELQPLVSSLIGAEQTLSQLEAAARRITAYYRSKDFAVARALLSAQDVTNGSVTITVVEGRVSNSKLSNTSKLSDALVGSYVSNVKPGDIVRSSDIARGLLLLQDLPGVGSSRATLQPGASVGTSELLVEVSPAAPYSASVVADNYGSRYTGEYRVSGNFALANPLGIGDQISFSGLNSGPGLNFGRLAYQIPIGSNGLRVGAAYSNTRYKLGKEFAALDAQGTASSASVYAAYPFIRSELANLSGTLSFEDKRLNDQINAIDSQTSKKINLSTIGLSGNIQDTLMTGGVNNMELTLAIGRLNINSPTALAIDAASTQTNGGFSRLGYSLSRLQRLGDTTLLSASLAGQKAWKNLDSSEKFSLGGATGIRAYPQGEANGDEGYKGSIELRQAFGTNWQGMLFYDFGYIKINKNPFDPLASNERSLAGVGIGLNASFNKVQVRTALAWRSYGGQATSVPAAASKNPLLTMQLTAGFF